MTHPTDGHLTEDERQGLADGTLPDESRLAAHLAACDPCTADVTRLRALMTRIHHRPPGPPPPLDAMWPAIRARIEAGKVVPLGAPPTAPARTTAARRSSLSRWPVLGGLAAAGLLVVALSHRDADGPAHQVARRVDDRAALTAVADSSRAYQQQVETLLEELELRRAMMRPATAASIDRDLHVIDEAIAELKAALARDPDNPALQQLLAASLRQKRDLLRQADDAS